MYVHNYTVSCLVCDVFQWYRAIPRHCVVAGCSTASGEGCSLHEFPQNKTLVQDVKHYQSNFMASSVLCSKHFSSKHFQDAS